MRFFVRKRRPTPAVIIVALIDVLIVLLIFLVVTTTFKHQPAIRLTLPESTQAQRSGATETPPLLVSIDAKGVLLWGTEALPVTEERLRRELLEGVARTPD
ncbi:MAG TPA: biopolymer transporter ExbD, partial [Verrucomicrobiota bacterium]|nr:biopolymer transporter ExbD [Verrucomicrobiota bacterium]